MKTLLINPPQIIYPASLDFSINLPIGIGYLAAVLDRAGHKVEVLDALVDKPEVTEDGDGKRYGMSWDKLKAEIRVRDPQVVGISNRYSVQIENAIKTAHIVKEVNPSILTIVGGPHMSVRGEEVLESAPVIDVAVLGEGEYTLLEIVQNVRNGRLKNPEGIEGIIYRDANTVRKTKPREYLKNLDDLPFPLYDIVGMEKYLGSNPFLYSLYGYTRRKRRKEIGIITSRGCPFNCIFCSVHLHMGKRFRAHSAEYVLEHLDLLVGKCGIEHIHFQDDNFTMDMQRTVDILDGIIRKGIKFTWDTSAGVRADKLDKEMLVKMKQAGCTELAIGVESGDQDILDRVVRKNLKLDDVIRVAKMCREVGIRLGALFVLGFPGEKLENMKKSIDFGLMLTRKYGVLWEPMVATPLYGTKLYEICLENDYLTEEVTPRSLAEATSPTGRHLIETEDFDAKDIDELVSYYQSNFRRNLRLCYVRHPLMALKRIPIKILQLYSRCTKGQGW